MVVNKLARMPFRAFNLERYGSGLSMINAISNRTHGYLDYGLGLVQIIGTLLGEMRRPIGCRSSQACSSWA